MHCKSNAVSGNQRILPPGPRETTKKLPFLPLRVDYKEILPLGSIHSHTLHTLVHGTEFTQVKKGPNYTHSICIHMCTRMCASLCVCYVYTYVYAYIYVYTHICMCMCASLCICYVYTYVYVYIYVYVHIYTHAFLAEE